MSELVFYPAIKNVDPILSPILSKFRQTNPGFTCETPFEIYNDQKNPLFKISSIEALMGKSDILRVVQNDQKKPPDDRVYTYGEDFVHGISCVQGSNQKRKSMFFTRRGFQMYLMTSRGDISNLFRKFLLVVLDELHSKGTARLDDALRATEEKYVAEIQSISNRLSHANELLEKEQIRRLEVETALSEAEIAADQLTMLNAHQLSQIKRAHEYSINMEEDFPSSKEEELRLLKQKYLKVVRVHVVPYEKIKQPSRDPTPAPVNGKPKNRIYEYMTQEKIRELGLDESSSEDEFEVPCGVREYNYNAFSYHNPPDLDEVCYYSLALTKKPPNAHTHVGDLYVADQAHYNYLKEYLEKMCSTPIKGVFATTFTEMEEKLREKFIKSARAE